MSTAIVWFRQDLRLTENPAFIHACNEHDTIIPLYIYDKKNSILGGAQQWWLHHSLLALESTLKKNNLSLILRQGNPASILLDIMQQFSVTAIYWNRCYEPQLIARDKHIKSMLLKEGFLVNSSNGNLFNEPWQIKNKQNSFYKVFTPYWKHCLQELSIPSALNLHHIPQSLKIPGEHLEEWQLLPKLSWADSFYQYWQPGEQGALKKLNHFIDRHLADYKINRDFPAKDATSKLSPHLHFGEISPWTILKEIELFKLQEKGSIASADRFLAELGWREFSTYLLYHFPDLKEKNFKKEFDNFPWDQNYQALERWQQGLTGYPLIDAGMRELWTTGYMQNRVRMAAASFLTKDLFIDWREGAAWFLDTLVDADLANNSASWQWVAGSGADAAPYFRIFNPVLQSKKYDAEGDYLRQWLPELRALNKTEIHEPWKVTHRKIDYPAPLILHEAARAQALQYYKNLKS